MKSQDNETADTISLRADDAAHHITVLHLFSGDLWAGAEVVIYTLLAKLHAMYPGVTVIALALNEGVLTQKLRSANIETHVIPECKHDPIRILIKATKILKSRNIQIIHSHRYKENVLAVIL